jgi:hypothetical protein
MKHRNLHHGGDDEPLDERLRKGRKAQYICASLQWRVANGHAETNHSPAKKLPPELPVNDDYQAYLESFDVRN